MRLRGHYYLPFSVTQRDASGMFGCVRMPRPRQGTDAPLAGREFPRPEARCARPCEADRELYSLSPLRFTNRETPSCSSAEWRSVLEALLVVRDGGRTERERRGEHARDDRRFVGGSENTLRDAVAPALAQVVWFSSCVAAMRSTQVNQSVLRSRIRGRLTGRQPANQASSARRKSRFACPTEAVTVGR